MAGQASGDADGSDGICGGPDGVLFDAPANSLAGLVGPYGTPAPIGIGGLLRDGRRARARHLPDDARARTPTSCAMPSAAAAARQVTFSNRRLWVNPIPDQRLFLADQFFAWKHWSAFSLPPSPSVSSVCQSDR